MNIVKYRLIIVAAAFMFLNLPSLTYGENESTIIVGSGYYTGNDFLKLKGNNKLCFVLGFFDGLCAAPLIVNPQANYEDWFSKIPQGVSSTQLEAIITKYVKKHPENWHIPFHVLGLEAMREAFSKEIQKGEKEAEGP